MSLELAPNDQLVTKVGADGRTYTDTAVKYEFHSDGTKYRDDVDVAQVASQGFYTDVDRARVVLQHLRAQGLDVLYCSGRGYFIYQNGIWQEDENDERLSRACHEVGDKIEKHAVAQFAEIPNLPTEQAKEEASGRGVAIAKTAVPYKRAHTVKSTIATLAQLPDVKSVKSDDLDRDLDILAVGNGLVDLRTGKLGHWHNSELVTTQVPFSYDEHQPADCPTWKQFLGDVLVDEAGNTDPELVDYMQRLIGYAITGRTSEQMFIVLHGIGANGKGVLTETLAHVFGAIARTTSFNTFEVRSSDSNPPIARLASARMVFASEGDSSKAIDSALIKRLTGQDRIEARFLYREPFEFTPRFLVMLSTNHRPNVRDHSEGYWRRIKMIPFRRYFHEHERNRNIHEELRDEAEGILAWAIEGARLYFESGLTTPEVIKAETQEYRETQDRLAEFVSTWLDVTGDPDDVVKVTDVWKTYRKWCDDVIEDHPLRRNTFVSQMRAKKGVGRVEKKNTQHFTGIKIKHDTVVRTAEMTAGATSTPERSDER